MGTKFLALGLSLCLVLSSFYEVSCQDEGTGGLSVGLIEHEYQANVNSLQGNEASDQTETSGQKNSTVTDNNTISLSLTEESVETLKESEDTSAQVGAVTDEVQKSSSMLDHIELEFEAHVNELKKAGSDVINKVDRSKDDEEAVRRHKMLEAIEREFEELLAAAAAGFEQLKIDDSTQGIDDEQSAKRQSMLDEIERDFEAATKGLEQLKADDLTGVNDEEHAARREKMLEEIEREFEEATKGLEELRHSTSSTDDEAHSAKRENMLDAIEREFEAVTSGLKGLKINAHTVKDEDDSEKAAKRQSMLDAIDRDFEAVTESFKQLEDLADSKQEGDQSATRQSMLDEVEREFEAVTESFKQLEDLADSKQEGDQSATRQSMLDEVEREFEAAASNLKQLNLDDFTEGDDAAQSAKRNSMLEAIEREFEAATKGLEELKTNDSTDGKDDDEHAARRKSMLDAIELEFEAATRGLNEIKNESKQDENKRSIMLEAIEREFEAVTIAKTNGDDSAKSTSTITVAQKTYAGNTGLEGLLKPADGVCGCFNQDKDGLKADTDSSINIAEILAEESKSQGSETSRLTMSLNNLVHTHREQTSSKVSSVLGSSSVTSTTSESSATSESIEGLKLTLKKLRGLSARDLVNHPNFDEIIAAGTRYEVLSSASIGYISLLAKYKTVIKEGLEASQRVQIAQTRAKLLKETAMEKQRSVDSVFASAKITAQRGDALHIRIVAIKRLLAKLEAEKVNVDSKFTSLTTSLSQLLKEASQAYEEYHEAVRKAKDEQAAEEFALETTKRAEQIWVEFLSSLN
ncbi:PREDICTED: TSA1-like protein isoform X2 [Camelina sativa]|uniref:TSA1-like protein isoform X2 n=1 Tax=Camelina sativa TaxID=90675 RepID=A0ABM0W4K2_CAMSA|nr:PREDICTED: TSA1-like protein isoform X2 [Camelina sativa]